MSIFIGTLALCLLAGILYLWLKAPPARREGFIEICRITFGVALLVALLGAGSQMSGCGLVTTGPGSSGVGIHTGR